MTSTKKEVKFKAELNFSYILVALINPGRLSTCLKVGSLSSQSQSPSCKPKERCALCEDFLFPINQHRQERVIPSDLLCVDASMSRWYGRGGEWISVGLPHYVTTDHKPEAGCEIQDISCGRSGIILGLSFVKSASDNHELGHRSDLNHGTNVIMMLCAPWDGSGRIVCADSYFASVEAASVLFDHGLRFIGVIKTSTKKYRIQYLGNLEMEGRGDHKTLLSTVTNRTRMDYSIAAVCWLDRNRRYFVSTVGTTLPGNVQSRVRMREISTELGARRIPVEAKIPSLVETYYSSASKIYRHNRCRQDDLDIEKSFQVREWSFRLNSTLLSICIVDSWLLYSLGRQGRFLLQLHSFYAQLAHELIDNSYDSVGLRERSSVETAAVQVRSVQPTSGAYEHLTPTKKRRRDSMGRITKWRMQQLCVVCRKKSTFACSSCALSTDTKVWFCHSSTGRTCFATHLASKHNREGDCS